MTPMSLQERVEIVQQRIADAAQRAGRRVEDITLVAVTKTHPPEAIQAAYALGLRDFGENRVEEMREKQAVLQLPDARWHMIGHVQSRKVKDLVGHTDLIHSVDRLSLAEEINKRATAQGTTVDVLLQVNTSGEESKGGWHVTTAEELSPFIDEVGKVLELPAIRVQGLMTIGRFEENPENTRPTFIQLRIVQQGLHIHFPTHDFTTLSMGMTNDYVVAIEEGATHVRIGTALFGARDYSL
jgi:PLP dependent protein